MKNEVQSYDDFIAELEHLRNDRPVYDLIHKERRRQHRKWGVQLHPMFGPQGQDPGYYGVPSPKDAKEAYEDSVASGDVNWFGILLEEVVELLESRTTEEIQEELVQIAAVCVAAHSSLKAQIREGK